MPDHMLDALKALVRLELTVGELYKACALRWPEDDQFWLEVAHQETGHAREIERMSSLISKNPAQFVQAKVIKVAAVNTIIAGIEKTTELVRTQHLLKINALTIAIDIENSIMEKQFYEMIKTADPAFLQLCHDIMEQTREHKEHFKKRMAAQRT